MKLKQTKMISLSIRK